MDTLYTADGCSYEGMDEDLVTTLRADLGRSTSFVDKETYDAYIEAHRVVR